MNTWRHNMTKKELVREISRSTGEPIRTCTNILNSFMEKVKIATKKGKKVTLVGFGTFYKTKQKARNGVNPRTGEKIKIPARDVVKCSLSKKLKYMQ